MRSLTLTTIAAASALLLTGCGDATEPNYVIDMSKELSLRQVITEAPGEIVLVQNMTDEHPVMIAGDSPHVVVEGDMPTGANLYVNARNATVTIKDDIESGATLTMEGGGSTVLAKGDVDAESTINLKGSNTTFIKDGFLDNIFGDSSSEYVDLQLP